MTEARRAHNEKVLIKSSRRHFRKAESKSSNGLFLSAALKTGKKQMLQNYFGIQNQIFPRASSSRQEKVKKGKIYGKATQPIFTCSNLTIKTLVKGVKCV